MNLDATLVIPTIGRPSLSRLLSALARDTGPRPAQIIVVDDRCDPTEPLDVASPVAVLPCGGRGPAAARNTGWRASRTRWVCFLDDDVVPQPGWLQDLANDLTAAETAAAAGSQGALETPPTQRRASDDEQRTLRLGEARWITADTSYRRDVLVAVGGFDHRFPRAYREDSDIALRITAAGHRILAGGRRCLHPVAPATWWTPVRVQVGNRDNALMRRKFGRDWRTRIGEGPGRLPAHSVVTAALLGGLTAGALRRRRPAIAAALLWGLLTTEFATRRFLAGSRTAGEVGRIIFSSMAIPPAAVTHRLIGEWQHRHARPEPLLAVLLDRDDTIVEDRPYLNDPAGVVPMPGARTALDRLRRRGMLLAVTTNQSGVARGLITPDQLVAVNAAVEHHLGAFDTWRMCVHPEDGGCGCRKPEPGLVTTAAADLAVPPQRCVLIGDTGGDVAAALTAGARAILVPTERTRAEEIAMARSHPMVRVAGSLSAAVAMVLREAR